MRRFGAIDVRNNFGTMVQAFPLHNSKHVASSTIESISMVGNLGARRWRWNPFIIDQDFKFVGGTFWERTVFLEGPKGTEHSGNFSCRLVINHNSGRHLKSLHVDSEALAWTLVEDRDGMNCANINFRLTMDS